MPTTLPSICVEFLPKFEEVLLEEMPRGLPPLERRMEGEENEQEASSSKKENQGLQHLQEDEKIEEAKEEEKFEI